MAIPTYPRRRGLGKGFPLCTREASAAACAAGAIMTAQPADNEIDSNASPYDLPKSSKEEFVAVRGPSKSHARWSVSGDTCKQKPICHNIPVIGHVLQTWSAPARGSKAFYRAVDQHPDALREVYDREHI